MFPGKYTDNVSMQLFLLIGCLQISDPLYCSRKNSQNKSEVAINLNVGITAPPD